MNVVVLEYEEKIQRGASQVAQLQEQLARQATRTDVNIDAYKRVSKISYLFVMSLVPSTQCGALDVCY